MVTSHVEATCGRRPSPPLHIARLHSSLLPCAPRVWRVPVPPPPVSRPHPRTFVLLFGNELRKPYHHAHPTKDAYSTHMNRKGVRKEVLLPHLTGYDGHRPARFPTSHR